MITTLHYYSYQSRISGLNNYGVKQLPFKKTIATSQSKPFNMKTAYNGDVISYAKNLSDSVNATKQTTTELLNVISGFIKETPLLKDEEEEVKDLEEFNEEEVTEDLATNAEFKRSYLKAKSGLKNLNNIFGKIKNLSQALNKTADFEKNSSESNQYNKYSSDISNIVQYSPSLNEMGIHYEEGQYQFDESVIESLSVDDVENLLTQSYKDLLKINKSTSELLALPLSSHMNFKDFSYYYSYSTGIMKNNSFSLVSSGTLLNLEL